MRANGGFAGSYAKLTLNLPTKSLGNYLIAPRLVKGGVGGGFDISFHDIYVPNGQTLDKYVVPPTPVQQAFGHGTWELANADWDPHFPTASTSLRWFFEKGGEINPDILGVINLTTIKKILNIIGSFEVKEYNATLTPDNLYLFLQGKAEMNFFPGSTQKADALHNVGQALIQKATSLSISNKIKIAKIIYDDLKNSNIVLNSKNQDFQEFLKNNKFAGEYLPPKSFDYFGMVEVNLGANKANVYIDRQTNHNISYQNNIIQHKIDINFFNHSPEANPNPPIHYGGNYIAYIRLYFPESAKNIQITHSELATDSAGINKEILTSQSPLPSTIDSQRSMISHGFWHITLAGSQSKISATYDLFLPNISDYSLTILKQNGLFTSPQTLDIFGQKFSTPLTSHFHFP